MARRRMERKPIPPGLRLKWLLPNEATHARGGRGTRLRRFRDAHRVVAHRHRILGVGLASSFAILNAMWFEMKTDVSELRAAVPEPDKSAE